MNKKFGYLVLDRGDVFRGIGWGDEQQVCAEVVFTTGMTGYEQSLTDPSFKGQVLVMAYPLMGNYGVGPQETRESDKIQVSGFVCQEMYPSSLPKHQSLGTWLTDSGVPVVTGIDTRKLITSLREFGVAQGLIVVSDTELTDERLQYMIHKKDWSYDDQSFLQEVSCSKPIYHDAEGKYTVCMIDLGGKRSITQDLMKRGINVWQMPYDTTSQDIIDRQVHGVFLTNGPGDPVHATAAIKVVKDLYQKKPIAGICLGHQVICLALGATSYKMHYGHRGHNHPIQNVETGACYITSQNHGYAIDEASLEGTGLVVTHKQLNDGSIEGVRHEELPIMSLQMHPEGSPGPEDCQSFFDEVLYLLK